MIERVKHILRKVEFKNKKSSSEEDHIHLSEEQIQMIAEYAVAKLTEKLGKEKSSTNGIKGTHDIISSDILEPKRKVIEQKEFSTGVRIGGIILLGMCIWYWIWFFFIVQQLEPLTYSVYITMILVALTLINKFESVLLNSITSITVYGFIMIAIGSIRVATDIYSFYTGPILYGLIGGFQLFIVLHRKIAVSKRYMFWGFLFYLLFISSFESFTHVNVIIGTEEIFPELVTAVLSFYILGLTFIVIYFYKKRFGILLP
ncbi:MAG: hypothetical protein ACFFDK_00175 [Promethearchaeota archaeon]